MVYAAEESDSINEQVASWAREKGAWVNVLDTPEDCDFITPAVVDRDPVVVAIGTEGTAPVLARQLKADIESLLPQHLGRLASAARGFREPGERATVSRSPQDETSGKPFSADLRQEMQNLKGRLSRS